jgi:hypothetical protein
MTPNLYIIAGPNGAGKTTFANQFLPNYAECREFVNADLIASGLSPFLPERAEIQAGRLMLERIKLLSSRLDDFGFESTLSGTAFVNLIKKLKEKGTMTEKKKKLSDIPIGIRAEEALKKAVAETIADHKRAGDPIVIWRDGEIVQIPPEQIEVREVQAQYEIIPKSDK